MDGIATLVEGVDLVGAERSEMPAGILRETIETKPFEFAARRADAKRCTAISFEASQLDAEAEPPPNAVP